MIEKMIITTTQHIEGYEIYEYMGLVGKFVYTEDEIESTLSKLAKEKMADALIGVVLNPVTTVRGNRYSTESDADSFYVYGTAVKIRKR